MDGLLARLKLGSKRKKKTASVKRTRPESARQTRDISGSLYSDLTASSSTVSATSAPDIVLKKDQADQVGEEKKKEKVVEQVEEEKKKFEKVVEKNDDLGRNLLNKKEQGPPSTIKESSESSQTIDDNESEKGGGQLKHENTVVRADGATGIVSSSNSSTASKSSSTNLSAQKQDIVRVTQTLLDAISCKDFDTYTRLCDTSMTCFEPEALGNLIEGIEFHRFYFDGNRKNQVHTTMLNPNVHIIGEDAACVAYVKLTQFLDRFVFFFELRF
ncbi:hypothetical protein CRE_23837 [Caenorhabditis remanei]|uniref:Calcium/calmodulin-dependent protein kinase II association-domain domain-containing protein n=1 Tax=Caenorhabditis remanei TaxID=31234 RepID=E3NTB0_CAERE|nr:hypothetical protein CRE_23837 [Caenorhabditis remanei]